MQLQGSRGLTTISSYLKKTNGHLVIFLFHPSLLNQLLLGVIIFILSLLMGSTMIHAPINVYDEGLILNNSLRILNGAYPYKDFWTVYSPGQFYTLSILFYIFGVSVLVERLMDVSIRSFIILILYIFLQQKIQIKYVLLSCFIAGSLLFSNVSFGTPVYPAILFALIAIICFDQFITTKKSYWIFGASIFTGVSIWYRWDIGTYSAISVMIPMLLYIFSHPQPINFKRQIKNLKIPSIYFLGVLLGIIIQIASLSNHQSLEAFFEQAIFFPATILRKYRALPFPPINIFNKFDLSESRIWSNTIEGWLYFYIPIIVYCTFFLRGILSLKKKFSDELIVWISLGIFGLFLCFYMFSRFDFAHTIPASLFVLPLFFYVAGKQRTFLSRWGKRIILLLGTILYFICPTLNYFYFHMFSVNQCYSDNSYSSCAFIDHDQEQAINFINQQTTLNDPIFVGNSRHDQIFINDVSFYFLANRKGGTPYYELHPGVATTPEIQNNIIQNLIRNNVRWVVLVDLPLSNEPNMSSFSEGNSLLDEYLYNNYSVVKVFGRYSVFFGK